MPSATICFSPTLTESHFLFLASQDSCTVHVTVAAAVLDGLVCAINCRIIRTAMPCKKRTSMVDSDPVATAHVIGSRQLDRSVHEMVTFHHVGVRSRRLAPCHENVMWASRDIC